MVHSFGTLVSCGTLPYCLAVTRRSRAWHRPVCDIKRLVGRQTVGEIRRIRLLLSVFLIHLNPVITPRAVHTPPFAKRDNPISQASMFFASVVALACTDGLDSYKLLYELTLPIWRDLRLTLVKYLKVNVG